MMLTIEEKDHASIFVHRMGDIDAVIPVKGDRIERTTSDGRKIAYYDIEIGNLTITIFED